MNKPIDHDNQPTSQIPLPRIDPVVDLADKDTDPDVHALVEDYLDRVCRPLIDTHPYYVRYDLRQELAQHIRSLTCAYEEMGDPLIEAAEKALAKFGDADSVARQWKLPAAKLRRKPFRLVVRERCRGFAAALVACGVTVAVCSVMMNRSIHVQQAIVREQIALAQGQSEKTAAISGPHHIWASQHQCIECHRSSMTLSAVAELSPQGVFWRLPQIR